MTTLPEEELYPDYLMGFVAGLVAALVLMPAHQLFILPANDFSFYMDWPSIPFVMAMVVAFATRLGAKRRGDIPMAIVAVIIMLIHIVGSEYLVAHRLVSEYGASQGYGEGLPLILPPDVMLDIFGSYLEDNSTTTILFIVGPVLTIVLTFVKDLGRVPRYGLSGRPQPTVSPQDASSTAAPAPMSMPDFGAANLPPAAVPADAVALGTPLRRHAVTGSGYTVAGVILILVAVFFFFLSDIQGMIEFGRTVLIGLGILLIALGLLRIIPALLVWGDRVVVYEHGLSITQARKHHIMRWAEIDEVWQNQYKFSINLIPIVDIHQYTLVGIDGSRYVFDNTYRKVGDLGATLQEAVTRVKLPRAGEALTRGETLNFGPIDISQAGLTWRNTLYAWHDLNDVGVWQGTVRIRRKNVSSLLDNGPAISKIPNTHLMFTIVYKILSSNRPG